MLALALSEALFTALFTALFPAEAAIWLILFVTAEDGAAWPVALHHCTVNTATANKATRVASIRVDFG
jgi:cyanate permease